MVASALVSHGEGQRFESCTNSPSHTACGNRYLGSSAQGMKLSTSLSSVSSGEGKYRHLTPNPLGVSYRYFYSLLLHIPAPASKGMLNIHSRDLLTMASVCHVADPSPRSWILNLACLDPLAYLKGHDVACGSTPRLYLPAKSSQRSFYCTLFVEH